MFRLRLGLAVSVLIGFALFLSAALYWSAQRMQQDFNLSQNAYRAYDRYERLSHVAYQYFKLKTELLSGHERVAQVAISAQHQLDQALDELKQSALQSQQPDRDLLRAAQFSAFFKACEYRFNDIARMRQQGQSTTLALALFAEQEIDAHFQPMLDEAIGEERQHAQAIQLSSQHLLQQTAAIAVITAIAAACFGLIAALLLTRALQKPIEALMSGTRQLAANNLDYRIHLHGRDEFAYLARHFNQMAEELQLQRDRLRDSRDYLEQRVSERTLELHQINAELMHRDEERRAFLADISHELRTPITIIRGEADVSLRNPELSDQEYRESLLRVQELAAQLSTYVNDLLFLARAECADVRFEWEELELSALLTGISDDLRLIAEEHQLSLHFTPQVNALWVRADRQRLRQMLFILGDNAVRYSKPGTTIEITLQHEREHALIGVIDQGIGIAPDDLPNIFQRHFRSANAQAHCSTGSGLGLSLAETIVRAHGGQIHVDSQLGMGSVFLVRLPLLPAHEARRVGNSRDKV
jgi:two-component system, OmpR family, sensor kinase